MCKQAIVCLFMGPFHKKKSRISPDLSFNENLSPFVRYVPVVAVVPWLYLKHHCRSWYSASWCWAHTACSSSAAAADIVLTSSQWPAAETMHRHCDFFWNKKKPLIISCYLFCIMDDVVPSVQHRLHNPVSAEKYNCTCLNIHKHRLLKQPVLIRNYKMLFLC